MYVIQTQLQLKPYKRGFHIITDTINALLQEHPIGTGTINLFLQHTSASLTINENVDPSVREDMEHYFTETTDTKSYYTHTYEGEDDMPAHIKSSLSGVSLTIPIANHRLKLGTWQGIYLCEYRNHGGNRKLTLTVMG